MTYYQTYSGRFHRRKKGAARKLNLDAVEVANLCAANKLFMTKYINPRYERMIIRVSMQK